MEPVTNTEGDPAETDRKARWRAAYDASPSGTIEGETMSGIAVEPVYGPDDAEFPGQYPYTRGPYASMYRSKLWTMRMFAGFGTAIDTNGRFQRHPRQRWRRPVDRLRPPDADGLRLRRRDEPRRGRHLRRRGRHPGRHGGPLPRHRPRADDDLDDDQLARGADLRDVHRRRPRRPARDRAKLGGTLQNDILKEYQAQKEFIFPPRPSLRLVRDTMSFCAAEMPTMARDLGVGVPHPRGRLDRRAGAGVHARQRVRLRRAGPSRRVWPSMSSRPG